MSRDLAQGSSLASFLGEISVFEGVSAEALGALAGAAEWRTYGPREVVYARGDACDGLYVVAEGGVALRKEVIGEPIERVRDIGPGDLLGEIELLDASPRQHQARTLVASSLVRIPPERCWTFLHAHPLVETRLRRRAIYIRTSRLHALLAPSHRTQARIRVDREVSLALPGGGSATARLEDLSHGGACLSGAPHAWQPGDAVRFDLGIEGHPGLLAVAARVRWRMGDTVGLSFEPTRPGGATGEERSPHAGDPGSATLRRKVDEALRVLVGASGATGATGAAGAAGAAGDAGAQSG
jgi:CRP-like cAMP-binding protein